MNIHYQIKVLGSPFRIDELKESLSNYPSIQIIDGNADNTLPAYPINSTVLDSANTKGYFANEVGTVGDAFFSRFNEFNGTYPGFPGYYVVEGVVLFGAEVVRPEAVIKLVGSLPVVTAGTFDAGTKGSSYTQTTPFSGAGSVEFTAVGLPAGLSLNTDTGAITGTPTTEGSYAVSIFGIDANGNYSNAFKGTIVIS